MLGSDGTVSIWDKDARTRMKSKPVPHFIFLSLAQLHLRRITRLTIGTHPYPFVTLVIHHFS